MEVEEDLGEGDLVEVTGVGVTVVGEGEGEGEEEGEEIEMTRKNGSQ